MADWFKFFENGLDEPRLQYAIGQLCEVTPVWVGILSECCRTKSGQIAWDDDEAYLMGFSRRLNVSVGKVNEAVNLLKRIRYIEVESGTLTVLKWKDLQSEYMRKKERTKPPVSGHSPEGVGLCPPRGEEKRVEDRRGEERNGHSVELPAGFPETVDDAVRRCSMIGCDVAFITAVWNQAMSRNGRDSKDLPIRRWQNHVSAQWSYQQSRAQSKPKRSRGPNL